MADLYALRTASDWIPATVGADALGGGDAEVGVTPLRVLIAFGPVVGLYIWAVYRSFMEASRRCMVPKLARCGICRIKAVEAWCWPVAAAVLWLSICIGVHTAEAWSASKAKTYAPIGMARK